jgi:hypothetical protein
MCTVLCVRNGEHLALLVIKTQLYAQLILCIFRQPLHVSGLSRPIIRRYNRMHTKFGTEVFINLTEVSLTLTVVFSVLFPQL